ncbi:hypothetical protein HWV62_41695 [Athelia sp. TMB]|nr:hypothetical protein HWV62_41695 [Athelia sp. TMB]
MATTPATQKALFLVSEGGVLQLSTKPIPVPAADELLIKLEATGLNPVDWMIQEVPHIVPIIDSYPAVLGFDSAGVVAAVGAEVKGFEKGDRVFNTGHFIGRDKTTFQEYTLVPYDVAAKIPPNVTFDQAASISVTLTTAAVGLYHSREHGYGAGLLPPWEAGGRGKYAGQPIVIFGGASSVGQFGQCHGLMEDAYADSSVAIQFARLSGFSPIIATASLHNTALLESLGATHVLSRSLSFSELASEIKFILAGAALHTVYDAVSSQETQQLGWDLLSSGGTIAVVLPPDVGLVRRGEVEGERAKQVAHVWNQPQLPRNREFARKLFAALEALLENGDIVPNRVEVLPHGLLGIEGGFEKMKKGLHWSLSPFAPMQHTTPPRTPPSELATQEYQQTHTPSDDSSIIELSFDYELDSAGNYVRVSKGGSSNRSDHSSPPTPQDPSPLSLRTYGHESSPLSTVTTAKQSASSISLNSPAAAPRGSLSRSESYPTVTGAEQRAPQAPAVRGFGRVTSGPVLSSANAASSLRNGVSMANGLRRAGVQRPGVSLDQNRESDAESPVDWAGEEKENVTDNESGAEYGGHSPALVDTNKVIGKRPLIVSPRLAARSASTSQVERITSALPSRSSGASMQHMPSSAIPSSKSSSRSSLARDKLLKGVRYTSATGVPAPRIATASSTGFERISEGEGGDGDGYTGSNYQYMTDGLETSMFLPKELRSLRHLTCYQDITVRYLRHPTQIPQASIIQQVVARGGLLVSAQYMSRPGSSLGIAANSAMGVNGTAASGKARRVTMEEKARQEEKQREAAPEGELV